MVWVLLLAHIIADYPLQPDWVIRLKQHPAGLLVHSGIHLIVMMLLCGQATMVLVPYLFVIVVFHYAVDFVKIQVSRLFPNHTALAYVSDQMVHILSILLVAGWIAQQGMVLPPTLVNEHVALYGVGYLLVSYVWFITERVWYCHDGQCLARIAKQGTPRMIARMLLLSILLFFSQFWYVGMGFFGIAFWLYAEKSERMRVLLTDSSVSMVVWLLLLVGQSLMQYS